MLNMVVVMPGESLVLGTTVPDHASGVLMDSSAAHLGQVAYFVYPDSMTGLNKKREVKCCLICYNEKGNFLYGREKATKQMKSFYYHNMVGALCWGKPPARW